MTLMLLDEDGDPRVIPRVPEGVARREHRLRDLIFDHPGAMPIHSLDPSYGRVFTVARELTIRGVGFVDVLLADEWGRLVLIECKLWRNPQARREVVGQILDYARELSRYGYEDLQRQMSVAARRSGNVLFELAREAGGQLSEADFVDRVERDLAAGRFLLLVVGDGISEGTRRIGEYLSDQPGLAFNFGLIEMAEYRYTDESGRERTIMQPRVLAKTATIERHVIRMEVPGMVLDTTADDHAASASREISDAEVAWRSFADAFVAQVRFDDPAQPSPRRGGNGWMRVPLPGDFYINLYRSKNQQRIGAQARFSTAEGEGAYTELLADKADIDREFANAGLPTPEWIEGEVPELLLRLPSALPWNEVCEQEQRNWFALVANQLVNSLRPRLQRMAADRG
jgi:hypothetical protein